MSKKAQKKQAPVKIASRQISVPVVANPVFEKYSFQITFGLLLLTGFFIFKDYLLLNHVYLFKDIGSDTLNASYPTFYLYNNYLKNYGFPSWSFSFGSGQNILPFFLRDPFDLILYLVPKDRIAYFIGYVEYLKVVASGLLFFTYLRLIVKDGFSCIVGTMLFTFSGFMILGGGWYIFSFEVFNLALLLLAFEKLYQQKKWLLFPIAIALIGISQPFNLYVYGLFLLTYALLRYYETEEKPAIKPIALLFGRMVAYGALGLMISALFLVPNIIQLLESPRGSGISAYTNALSGNPVFKIVDGPQFQTIISRFFSNDLLGTGINFKGWSNYLEAPLFYCGLITLLLVPAGFTLFNRRQKIVYGIFIAAWLLPLFFPYFRYAFWLFTGDYYRGFSFCVVTGLIYVAVRSINLLNKSNKKAAIAIIGLSVLFLLIGISTTTLSTMKDSPLFFLATLFIVIYAVLILVLNRNNSPMIRYAILALLCIEMSVMGATTTSDRETVNKRELNERSGYNDFTMEAMDFLKGKEKSFFRIDKNYASSPAMHYSHNDAMVQDFYSTSQYSPFNQINYVRFLDASGVINAANEVDSRWIPGLISRPLLQDLFSVKYILMKGKLDPRWTFKLDSVAAFGDVTVLRNHFSLPLGFTYSQFMLYSDYRKVSRNFSDVALLSAFVVPDSTAKEFSAMRRLTVVDTAAFNIGPYEVMIDSLRKDTLKISSFRQSEIKGTITLSDPKLLFFSIPYDKGWSAQVNGKPEAITIADSGMMGLLLEKGQNTIELSYAIRYFMKTLLCSIAGCVVFSGLFLLERMRINKQATGS